MWSTPVADYSKRPPCFTSLKYLHPSCEGLGQGFGITGHLFSLMFSKDKCFSPENTG